MILVPLSLVLYMSAIVSFVIAGYYGFRLSRLAKKLRVMVMVTQDGPASIVGGIVILALSQVMNVIQFLPGTNVEDLFAITSGTLLVGAAVMFAIGFHKMYAIYLNERLRTNVYSALEELVEVQTNREEEEKEEQAAASWRRKFR